MKFMITPSKFFLVFHCGIKKQSNAKIKNALQTRTRTKKEMSQATSIKIIAPDLGSMSNF